jgi:exosortase A
VTRSSALPVGIGLAGLAVLHFETFESIVFGWLSSATYSHGFITAALGLFFAWRQRHALKFVSLAISLPGLAIVCALVAVWVMAKLLQVQIIEQIASVALIGAIIWALAGSKYASILSFPLSFLLLVVPMGDGLIPLLMEITAEFTVSMVDLVGIPVIRDGMYFSTSTGSFEVTKACSGVRYLIASTTLGIAYASMFYRGMGKRLVFIVVAIIVPIIANGFRAFVIVLIAHFSNMKYATGVDHLVYGWVFFGITMLILFSLGSRFAETSLADAVTTSSNPVITSRAGYQAVWPAVLVAILVVILLAAGTLLSQLDQRSVEAQGPGLPSLTSSGLDFRGPMAPSLEWSPAYRGADAEAASSYVADDGVVELRVLEYFDQAQGSELINSRNRVADGGWQSAAPASIHHTGAEPAEVFQEVIFRGRESYTVWYWYQIGETSTVSAPYAKWLELSQYVSSEKRSLLIAIASVGADADTSTRLRRFLVTVGPSLEACLVDRSDQSACELATEWKYRRE